MKKLVLILCFVILSSPKIYSQLFVENFNYPLGTVLSTTPAWRAVSDSGSGTLAILVLGGSLTFPMYAGSGIGNAVTLLNGFPIAGEDDAASLSSIQTTGSVYASFMIRVNQGQPTGDYFFSLRTSGGADVARVYIRGVGYNIGIEKAAGSGVVYASPNYMLGTTTYLVVMKYTFVAGAGNDQMSLFVFDPSSPPPAVEPTPILGPVTFPLGADAVDLAEVLLRLGGPDAPILLFDGIYVDNSWNNNVLPVELSSFTSTISNRDVTLNWMSISEVNNSTFEIERFVVNGRWSTVGSIHGNGTTNTPHSYTFTDRGLNSGKYNYRLKQIDYNGNYEYFNLGNEVGIGIPAKFDLSQNYPNPFNPTTNINYDIPFDGKVSIKLYDVSGREVLTLVNDIQTAGYYTVNFNGTNLSSGVYFYRLTAEARENNFVMIKKMILIK